jgi:hypothetical protein
MTSICFEKGVDISTYGLILCRCMLRDPNFSHTSYITLRYISDRSQLIPFKMNVFDTCLMAIWRRGGGLGTLLQIWEIRVTKSVIFKLTRVRKGSVTTYDSALGYRAVCTTPEPLFTILQLPLSRLGYVYKSYNSSQTLHSLVFQHGSRTRQCNFLV